MHNKPEDSGWATGRGSKKRGQAEEGCPYREDSRRGRRRSRSRGGNVRCEKDAKDRGWRAAWARKDVYAVCAYGRLRRRSPSLCWDAGGEHRGRPAQLLANVGKKVWVREVSVCAASRTGKRGRRSRRSGSSIRYAGLRAGPGGAQGEPGAGSVGFAAPGPNRSESRPIPQMRG